MVRPAPGSVLPGRGVGAAFAGETVRSEPGSVLPGRDAGAAFAGEAAREGGGHGAARGTEGVERLRIVRQHPDAALHPVRGGPGEVQELFGRLPALARQAAEVRAPVFDP